MLRRLLKRGSFHCHRLALRLGVIVLPRHFYASVSSVLDLERTKAVWARKSDLPGIRSPLEDQAANLRRICLPYGSEYAGNRFYRDGVDQRFGLGYGYIEAQALHGVLRHFRPTRVIEVGGGVSTYCMASALQLNHASGGPRARLTTIDPAPSAALTNFAGVELVRAEVQTVPLSLFSELGERDLLFVDSSHTVRPGSDVNFLILEVLPRLKRGVLVHFHDIFLPYDYQRNVLQTYFQWMETSLLRAYLMDNSRASVLFCLSQLHYDCPEVLREVFPEYVPAPDENGLNVRSGSLQGHFPASIFFEVS
jgi:predicted O-methyltransferase YrrM